MRIPVHRHDLIIREKGEGEDGLLKCRACKETIPGQINYYWCNICRSYFHEDCAELPLEIKHFFHPCPLFLHFYYFSFERFNCNSCFKGCSGVYSYICVQCDFDMCLECATREVPSLATTCDGGETEKEKEKENILHCCHHHPLQPIRFQSSKSSSSSSSCQVCNMPCSSEPATWGCEPCNFHLHKSCLDFLPEMVQTKQGSELASWILRTSPKEKCMNCHKYINSNLVFRRVGERIFEHLCIFCCLVRRLVDESSSDVPEVINHFNHPCPSYLKLILSPPSSTCNACLISLPHFSYHCNRCDFFLCLDCTQLPDLSCWQWHPLKLITGTYVADPMCYLCERFCSEPFYSCINLCQFYIHKSCMDSLPHKTKHLLLNQIIVLLHVSSFECTTCNQNRSGLAYYCSKRRCSFCVKCVLWPERVLGDDGRYKSILHWHQLSLHETRIEDKRQTCFLCKEPCISGTWSYKCSECALFFHKSCAELPAELEHPIHPQHHLTLTNRSSTCSDEAMTCKLCLKSLSENFPPIDLVYRCHQCGFQLDTQCATNCLPSVEYNGHPHLLYIMVNMYGNTNCQACSEPCKGGSSALRCAGQECNDFSLHLLCGPLPRTIKHACHIHPLAIQDYYVEDNGSDEFACHVCEEERDPRLRVFCCTQGCLMICDVKCVMSEVLPLLRGERGEVELRTPFPQVSCRVINTNELVFAELKSNGTIEGPGDGNQKLKDVFSLEELIESLFKSDNKYSYDDEETYSAETTSESDDDDTNLNKEVESYSFSWKALSRFAQLLRPPSDNNLSDDFVRQYYEGSIMTGAYALPEILGPIYDEFFGMHNIVDDKSRLNYAQKRFLIFVICCVLHHMRITKVVDVTKDTILQWLGWIRSVQRFGRLNVGFVAENIKQLWKAHYYIQSKKIVDDKSSQLRQGIDQETKTVEELRTKLAEAEARLEKLQLEENEHDAYRVAGSRGPMKKVRKEALEIKWRTCYESLITYPGNAPTKK